MYKYVDFRDFHNIEISVFQRFSIVLASFDQIFLMKPVQYIVLDLCLPPGRLACPKNRRFSRKSNAILSLTIG